MNITLNDNYSTDSAMNLGSKHSKVHQENAEVTRFEQEIMKAQPKMACDFATPLTKEELFQQWDEKVKENQDKKMTIYEMLAARPYAKDLMYHMVGSSKVYTFDEYVKEVERMIQELLDK